MRETVKQFIEQFEEVVRGDDWSWGVRLAMEIRGVHHHYHGEVCPLTAVAFTAYDWHDSGGPLSPEMVYEVFDLFPLATEPPLADGTPFPNAVVLAADRPLGHIRTAKGFALGTEDERREVAEIRRAMLAIVKGPRLEREHS